MRALCAAFLALGLAGGAAFGANFDTLIAQGKDAVSQGRFADGEAIFKKALVEKPGHPEALYGAGMCASAQGASTRALDYFGQVLRGTYSDRSLRGFHILAMQRMGEIYIQKGKVDDAVTLFRQGVRNEPDDPEMHQGYGMALRVKGMNEMALQQFEEAIRLNPKHSGAHVGRAAVLFDMGKVPEAFEMLSKAIELSPGNPLPYGVMSRFYAELRKPYEENLSLGSYYYGSRQFADAEKALRAALKLKDTAEVRQTLGTTLLQTGKLKEAEDNIRKAISKKVKPEDPAWAALSAIMVRKGDLPGARKAIDRAIKAEPRQASYHAQSALIGMAMDDDKAAEKAARKALELQPGFALALRYLGDIYNKRGKGKEAIENYEKSLVADPTPPDVYVNLGWAYEQVGDFVSARRNYETFLRLSKDSDAKDKVRAQIKTLENRGSRGSGK